jgi:nicotinate-nucleotide pyrophosphorylase (carboxylating)
VDRFGSALSAAVRAALEEDRAFEDITTGILAGDRSIGSARIIARAGGVISGQDCAAEVFRQLGGSLEYTVEVPDGTRLDTGAVVSRLHGPLGTILAGERTALNYLGHLSGIATLTARFVERVGDSGARILDTRKTLPGLRFLEKRAVRDGGGINHRPDLGSYILVKENHILAAGGLDRVLDLLGEKVTGCEIEVTGLDEIKLLSQNPPGRIMLDNFTPGMIRDSIEEIKGWSRSVEIEVSGGITLDNIEDYKIEGIDYISIGSLTLSAPSLDLSLLLDEVGGER